MVENVTNGMADPGSVRPIDCAVALKRIGLKVAEDKSVLYIANRCQIAERIFDRTPWAVSWLATISRAPGAKRDAANIRLPTQTKCMSVPIGLIVTNETDTT